MARPFVLIIEMTLLALYTAVLAFEGVRALGVMIKGYERPLLRRVTLIAWKVDLPFVKILMAVTACGVDRLKMTLLMTAFAGGREMSTSELKATARVIKEGDRP